MRWFALMDDNHDRETLNFATNLFLKQFEYRSIQL